MMPTSVCVVSGPFIGCHETQPGTWQVWSNSFTLPCGLPKSHAMRSLRPSTWQVAQLSWPSPEVSWVSNRKRRPAFTPVGVGSCSATRAISVFVLVAIVESEPSNRFSAYRCEPPGCMASPVGPSPMAMVAMRAPLEGFSAITLLLPRPATYATVPAALNATPRGSPIDCRRFASDVVVCA